VAITGDTSKASLLDLTLAGNFDAAFEPRKSTLTVTSAQTIDAKRLQALLPVKADATPAPAGSPAPQPGGQTTVETTNLPPIWAEIDVKLARVDYGQVIITDYLGHATLKDNLLVIDNSDFKVNQTGTGKLTGQANLHDLTAPTFAGKVDFQKIPAQPFLATFVPHWKMVVEGVTSVQMDLTGSGREPETIKRTLTGNMLMTIDRMQLKSFGSKNGDLLAQIIGTYYGLRMEDIVFTEGLMDGAIGSGRFTIGQMKFLGPLLKLTSTGFYDFGKAEPDFNIVLQPYVTQAAERQIPSHIAKNLVKMDDGWFKADPWPLTPDSVSKSSLTLRAASKAVGGQAGEVIDAATKAKEGDLGGALKGVLGGGLLGGDKKEPAKQPEGEKAPAAPQPAPEEKKEPPKGVLDLF
jgi:hypothetical protein